MKSVNSFTGLALLSVLLLSSCVTTTKTARTAATRSDIKSFTVADLRVTDHRVTYTLKPSKDIQRGGLENVKQAAIQEALTQNGNADVMLEPEFVIEQERTLLGKRVNAVTVTGRPAYYENFRKVNDSVWHNPGFYGQPDRVCCKKHGGDSACCEGDDADCEGGGLSRVPVLGGLLGGKLGKLLGGGSKSGQPVGDIARSGFGGRIEAIGGVQKGEVTKGGDYKTNEYGYVGGLVTLGYHLTPHWFLGAGTGFFYDFQSIDEGFIPIYADVRYSFSSRKKSTWFIDYKIGASVLADSNDGMKGGLFLMPSVGYSFGGFDVALQWGTQYLEGKHGYDYRMEVTHVGLSLGFSF